MSRLLENTVSPLEQFLRQYAEARDGVWDEIEPQVYDVLVGSEMMRTAFDPEALPEHPEAKLVTLGSPLLDGLLADAASRWSAARFYRLGLNLHPHNLESRLARAIDFPAGATFAVRRTRAMHFPQAIFWFKATFSGDQKEEEILPIGVDLHYGRQTRRLETLLAAEHLSEQPATPMPEAPHVGLVEGFRLAREWAAPTVASLANVRRRAWSSRTATQIERMSAYYAQLRREAAERNARDAHDPDAAARHAARVESIGREEQLRIAELRQKSAIRVRLKLSSYMLLQQPKLLADITISASDQRTANDHRAASDPRTAAVQAVWDPLIEAVEAIACPNCGRPTFSLHWRRDALHCPACGR